MGRGVTDKATPYADIYYIICYRKQCCTQSEHVNYIIVNAYDQQSQY
jgi:hypothetical protein